MLLAPDGAGSAPRTTVTPVKANQPATATTPAGGAPSTQGASSTATWPDAKPDTIDTKGLSPQLLHVIREQQQLDANAGTFNDGGTPTNAGDQRFLHAMGNGVQYDVQHGRPLQNTDTQYGLGQYLQGKIGGQDPSLTPAQRLGNVMAALGPEGTQAYLGSLSNDDYNKLGIQSSFDHLVSSGSLTTSDARQLVWGQKQLTVGDQTYNQSDNTVEGLVAGLPADGPNGNATLFKSAFAHESLSEAEGLTSDLHAGRYSGAQRDDALYQRQKLYSQARDVLAGTPNDDAKRAAFRQMLGDANALTHGSSDDKRLAGSVYAYAADTLGHASPQAAAAELRGLGGLNANGTITPGSKLDSFVHNAIAGQAAFGTNVLADPLYSIPGGISSLLETASKSGDPTLTAGLLHTTTDALMQHPDQAQSLANQDALGTGFHRALSDALDSSFNQFVGSTAGHHGLDPQTSQQLETLGEIEMSPPFGKDQAGSFAQMIGRHAGQFAKYANGDSLDPSTRANLNAFFAGDPADRQRDSAQMFSGIMNSFFAGYNDAQQNFDYLKNNTSSGNEQRASVAVDFLTGVAGAAAFDPATAPVAAGAGIAAAAVSALKDFGVPGFSNDSAKEAAIQSLEQQYQSGGGDKALEVMQQFYDNWYADMNKAGPTGEVLTQGLATGSTIASSQASVAATRGFVGGFHPSPNPLG